MGRQVGMLIAPLARRGPVSGRCLVSLWTRWSRWREWTRWTWTDASPGRQPKHHARKPTCVNSDTTPLPRVPVSVLTRVKFDTLSPASVTCRPVRFRLTYLGYVSYPVLMTRSERDRLTQLIQSARVVVRETGYAAQKIEASLLRGELYSCVLHAYDLACLHLQRIDPTGATEFIRSTYGPAFRQSAA